MAAEGLDDEQRSSEASQEPEVGAKKRRIAGSAPVPDNESATVTESDENPKTGTDEGLDAEKENGAGVDEGSGTAAASGIAPKEQNDEKQSQSSYDKSGVNAENVSEQSVSESSATNSSKRSKKSRVAEKNSVESVQESENVTRKSNVTKSFTELSTASEAAPETRVRRKRGSKPKSDQDEGHTEKENGSDAMGKESATTGTAAADASEGKKFAGQSFTYGQPEVHYGSSEQQNGPAASANSSAPAGSAEKQEGIAPTKTSLSSDEPEPMESGWKFDEKDGAEPSAGYAAYEDDKEHSTARPKHDFSSQAKEDSTETKTEYRNLAEQQNMEERTTERHTLKYILIALLIVAILYLLIFFLWNRHVGAPALTQFRNLTANVITNSNSSSRTVHISGIVSPPPRSTNSVVITVIGPLGGIINTTNAPVLTTGKFGVDITIGGNGKLQSGTYTVDSNYYGTRGVTTFYFNTTMVQVRNLTANAVTNSYTGNSVIHVSGVVSPAPKSANSIVVIYVIGPRGTQVATSSAPISTSGFFNSNMTLGSGSSLSNGTYTVTSNYNGNSGRTTFVLSPIPYNSPNWLVNALCNIYGAVHSIVFLLSILLVVLGAILYSAGPILPGAHKGQLQGYGMGMVIGGVIGTFIAVFAPYIVGLIAGGSLPVAQCISGLA